MDENTIYRDEHPIVILFDLIQRANLSLTRWTTCSPRQITLLVFERH